MRKLEKIIGDAFLFFLKLSVIPNDISAEKIDHSSVKNILIVLRHQMGDMLCATPMIRSLKAQYPDSNIILVTKNSTNFNSIFKDDTTIVSEVKEFESGFENFIKLVYELRNKKIDLAVVPSPVVFSVTNHLMAYFTRAKIRAGVEAVNLRDNKSAFLLNVKSEFKWDSQKVHIIERNLDVIRQLGIEPEARTIKVGLNRENINFAEKFYSENFPDRSKPVIGFHPGASKPGNVWAAENYAGLAAKLFEKYKPYIFISEGPSDAKYVNEFCSLLEHRYNIGTFKRHHGVLMNNIALINWLNIFLTNDTGVMHLASGLDIPVVAFFGPTSAHEWGPIGENKFSLQSATENINGITVENAYEVCQRIL